MAKDEYAYQGSRHYRNTTVRLIISVMIFCGMFFIYAYGGRIEGLIYPVKEHFEVIEHYPDGPSSTMIYGRITKSRDCTFRGVEWYLGTHTNNALADVTLLDGPLYHGKGRFEFGPWRVMMNETNLLNHSFALMYHACHPLWLTITPVYPPLTR